ncbi:PhzF family phenazine biosynthesis protein [Roseibium alexandrii]|uniref:PhzF family phenazine biosynthesis protein n=1 Tax=Roseibium alexandrii TaxID=388408 RepID=UPI0037518D71
MKAGGVRISTVFGGPGAQGNVTATVFSDVAPKPDLARDIASTLTFPETGFVWPAGKENGTYNLMSQSPFEELSYCTQTMLAAAEWLLSGGGADAARIKPVGTQKCEIITRDESEPTIFWASTAAVPPQVIEVAEISPLLPIPLAGPFPLMRIVCGRTRLVQQINSLEQLYELAPTPDNILAVCKGYDCQGLVVFYSSDAERIHVRVFTTSLGGAEDLGTGGAAAAMAAYLESAGSPLGCGAPAVIEQGTQAIGKGQLFLRVSPSGIFIGGRVCPVLGGHFLGQPEKLGSDR